MRPDIDPILTATGRLGADLELVHLADPAGVRRRGERRARNQLAVTVVGAAVLIAAMVGGTWMITAGPGERISPATRPAVTDGRADPTVVTTPGATSTPFPGPRTAPTTRPAPTRKVTPTKRVTTSPTARPTGAGRLLPELRTGDQNAGDHPYLAPPRPCGPAGRPSDSSVVWSSTARAPVSYEVEPGQVAPRVIVAYVADLSGDAAETFMAELRADVAACPGEIGEGASAAGFQWSIVDTGVAGDDSVLLQLRGGANAYFDEERRGVVYVAVARVGDTVVTLANLGWEGYNGDEAFTRVKFRELVALQ